jgi:hypothetical protein
MDREKKLILTFAVVGFLSAILMSALILFQESSGRQNGSAFDVIWWVLVPVIWVLPDFGDSGRW